MQNSHSLCRFERAQKAPTKGEELPGDALPSSSLSNRAVIPDRPHLPPLFLTAACTFPRSRTPAAVAAAPRCRRAGRAQGEPSRPWARPGLPPLPALLSPTRPRAHQAAAGGGGGARPGSPAGPAGRGEPSTEIPPGAASSRPGLSQGKHDAGGEQPISRRYRPVLARAPAAPRLRPPQPPVRGHAQLAAEVGAAAEPAAGAACPAEGKHWEWRQCPDSAVYWSSASVRKSRPMLLHKNDQRNRSGKRST